MVEPQWPAAGPRRCWVLLALLGVLVACGGGGGPDTTAPARGRDRATPVIVAQVDWLAEETRVEAVGTSRALRSVVLFPVTAGRVVSVGFETGQKVAAGSELLRLDDREQTLAVDLARIRVADAERLLARYRRMQGSGAVTQADIDDAASALDAAEIELRRARVALEDRRLLAPFDGHVGLSEVDVGDRVDTDTPITTLDDRTALLVSFPLPEILIGRLAIGEALNVSTWVGGEQGARGRVVEIDSRIDPATRTFVARARVDNLGDRLRPGMSFRVRLALLGGEYPVVPEVSVLWGGDGAYVWRIAGDRAERVGVAVVQRRQGRVLVDGALARGDRVVVEGVQRMRPGLVVSLLEEAAPAPTPVRGTVSLP